jgi:hypothetical protein
MLLDVKEDGEKVKFGLDRTLVEEENNIDDMPFFVKVKNKSVDIVMELVHCSDQLIPLPFTNDELKKIGRWIFKSEYKPLTVGGKTYQVLFEKNGEKKEYGTSRLGYITLTAHVRDGFSHTNYIIDVEAKGEKIEVLHNTSEVDKTTYLDMNITQISNTKEDIIIKNLSNGDELIIKNVAKNENIMVYSKDMEIYSLTNKENNVFNNTTYNSHFITLRYGKNKLKCTGNFKVTFTYDLLGQI